MDWWYFLNDYVDIYVIRWLIWLFTPLLLVIMFPLNLKFFSFFNFLIGNILISICYHNAYLYISIDCICL